MYVIGKSDYEFIKISHSAPMYDGRKTWNEIQQIECEAPLSNATIIGDYEHAEEILNAIRFNIENIDVVNYSVIGEILDREKNFDKIAYSKELKIYELVPMLVTEKN